MFPGLKCSSDNNSVDETWNVDDLLVLEKFEYISLFQDVCTRDDFVKKSKETLFQVV